MPRLTQSPAQVRVVVDTLDCGDERIDVVDVREEPVLALTHELRSLPDAGRHEGHATRHRLERGLRASLLARCHETQVDLVVRTPELFARGQQQVAVRNAEALELTPHVATRGACQQDGQLADALS